MQKYLILVRDLHTDNTAVLQIAADSPDDAVAKVDLTEWKVLRFLKPWVDKRKRKGTGRVKTHDSGTALIPEPLVE